MWILASPCLFCFSLPFSSDKKGCVCTSLRETARTYHLKDKLVEATGTSVGRESLGCIMVRKRYPRRYRLGALRAVSPLSTQIGVFDFFLVFTRSKNAFQKILGTHPRSFFLIYRNLSTFFCGEVWRPEAETFSRGFLVLIKSMFVENSIKWQVSPKMRISERSDAE